jgi:uncharacterized protein with GYD domain
MPKYLYQISYTADGAKGLAKEGGSKRRAAAEQMATSLGGKIESMYFALGETDAYAIVDVPDHATAAAASLTVAGSGAAAVRTTVLLTAEELDQAASKTPAYRVPGK